MFFIIIISIFLSKHSNLCENKISNFAGSPLLGPLKYPNYYKHPIILVQPVSFITKDLLKNKKISPYL